MVEIEQIEEESQLQIHMAEANDLMFMLTARLDESKCMKDKMDVKLGYSTYKSRHENAGTEIYDLEDEDYDQNTGQNDSEPSNSHSAVSNSTTNEQNNVDQGHHRSIKPPQATLPKFHGNAEEFPEFWAIFETLVHKSRELDVMEKILLLKESLRGRAQTIIKG
ncbi:hypothetical protein OESDEN_13400 [Oesophagostomum dentatum]|uniref:Uncharacterized protein n=1 Tax=Oesophagostomum dentatum TaxID=61180 RepID=A0A0B1SSG3_OESDE|nr:hypothetical protein OESDEN_13400 [Oesophagostomum dentatum]